jgi:aqualysin 1
MNRLHITIIITIYLICLPDLINAQPRNHVKFYPQAESNTASSSGKYIVLLKDSAINPGHRASSVNEMAKRLTGSFGGRVQRTYHQVLNGFSLQISESMAREMAKDPSVAHIETDSIVSAADVQDRADWGLDRIDQRYLPISSSYTYNSTGLGINVYVIDSGIRVGHKEFQGRASIAFDAVGDGLNGSDCNGHGTHVAGIIGGKTYGVAKNVNLFSVRVLGCDGTGSLSQLISGIEWITQNHIAPAVVNISINGPSSPALDQAIQRSIASGITYVTAAGNNSKDACQTSPARVTEAFTVGSTTQADELASFSNTGRCIDILAPGSNITSAWYTDDTATQTLSGTSLSTAFTTGAAALYLEKDPAASPFTVTNAILSSSTINLITKLKNDTPNRLLYSLLTYTGNPSSPIPNSDDEYQQALQQAKAQLNNDMLEAQKRLDKALQEAKTQDEVKRAHDTYERDKRAATDRYNAATRKAKSDLSQRLDQLQYELERRINQLQIPMPVLFCMLASNTHLGTAEELKRLYEDSGVFITSNTYSGVGVFITSTIASDRTGLPLESIISERESGYLLGQLTNEYSINPHPIVNGIDKFLRELDRPTGNSCLTSN